MKRKNNLILAVVVLVLLIGADQFTKHLATLYLAGQNPVPIIPGVFELQFLMNRGAAFGILQNHPYFFAVVTGIVLCGLVYLYLKIPFARRYFLLHGLLVLLAAGAVGNLLDRLRMGYVVDFLYFKLINFPIFNVADCYVVISVITLAVLLLFYYKEEELDQIFSGFSSGGRREKKD